MKFLYSVCFLITAIYSLSGQYSYHIKISSLPDGYPTAAVQINGGTIILSTIRGDYSSQKYYSVLTIKNKKNYAKTT
jgi:microcystin degradation protein MlrC